MKLCALTILAFCGIIFSQASTFVPPNHAAIKISTNRNAVLSGKGHPSHFLRSADHQVSNNAIMGEVRLVALQFDPKGWAACDGQMIKISDNMALYSLLGTTFGGDGRTTFALPDLRGRTPVHVGAGPGLAELSIGEQGGGTKVAVAEDEDSTAVTQPALGLRYIICLEGAFPGRE